MARDQDGEYYLVTPELTDELLEARPDRVHRSMLFVAANSEGVGFLWPVKPPVPEAHLAYRAMREWVCFPSETRH